MNILQSPRGKCGHYKHRVLFGVGLVDQKKRKEVFCPGDKKVFAETVDYKRDGDATE